MSEMAYDRLAARAGQVIGPLHWIEIDQARIDRLAEVSGDDGFNKPVLAVVPQRKIEPVERKPERRPPVQRSAPPLSRQAVAELAAPAADPTPRPDSAALPTWKSQLVRHLERHKRYPAEAQRARHQGVAYIRFVTGRDGKVSA